MQLRHLSVISSCLQPFLNIGRKHALNGTLCIAFQHVTSDYELLVCYTTNGTCVTQKFTKSRSMLYYKWSLCYTEIDQVQVHVILQMEPVLHRNLLSPSACYTTNGACVTQKFTMSKCMLYYKWSLCYREIY